MGAILGLWLPDHAGLENLEGILYGRYVYLIGFGGLKMANSIKLVT